MTAIYEILVQGGAFVIPIVVCSVIGLALFIERLVYLRPERIVPNVAVQTVQGLLEDGRLVQAEGHVQEIRLPDLADAA